MHSTKNKEGVSLVELMVALGLVALVFSAAGLMYFTGVKGWDRCENQVEVQQNLRIAMNVLNTEIRRADAVNIYLDEKKIVLTYSDASTKTYEYKSDAKEIRLGGSSSTVAMYIDDCVFDYDAGKDLIEVSIIIQGEAKPYTFKINARGKIVNES